MGYNSATGKNFFWRANIFMQIKTYLLALLFAAATLSTPVMAGQIRGRAIQYTSPGGVPEQCIALTPMPGGKYRIGDRQQEQKYCGIDLYNTDTALCPKIWSTSPGTIIYDLSAGSFAGMVSHFERTACRNSKGIRNLPVKQVATFKSTMNASETSGTFSTASLLYYHFSRYFDTMVDVPVAVWRSIDRKNHLHRVTKSGVHLSNKSRMLHAGWLKMEAAEENPITYHPENELFTADGKAIYGILLSSPGHRYNTSVNGTRASGWGIGQNNDFQETAPYLALRSGKPLAEAVRHGLHSARRSSKMNRDLGKNISAAQMVFWMTELTELTLLDYIFNQQDRIGNIDYLPYWYWTDNGQVHKEKAHAKKIPSELNGKNAVLIKRTQLNDNDAGGRLAYINFTKKTKMLEKQRHYRAASYKQLLRLNQDFAARGSLYQYLQDTFALSEKQLRNIVKNTAEATAILQKTCREGKLRFDLQPYEFMLTGTVAEKRINCDQP